MTELVNPPAVASAIVNFFAHQPDFPALAGDMSEEFHHRVEHSGARAAKLWFWKEAFRNAWALTAREVARTPVRTTVLALGCLLAINAISDLYMIVSAQLLGLRSPLGLLDNRAQRDVILILQFVVPFAIGWMGRTVLRGREWALALTFTFLSASLALSAWMFFVRAAVILPAGLTETAMVANSLRQVAFWMGCLGSRHSSVTSSRA